MLLMCWVITCLSSTMTCLLFCGAKAQYWGGGAWGRKDAFNDEIPKWLEVCIHDEKRSIVNNLRGIVLFAFVFNRALDQCLDGDVYSGELPVFARYGRDQRSMWSVFNKKCSRGERKYLRTAQRMHIHEFAKLDIAKAKTREHVCTMYVCKLECVSEYLSQGYFCEISLGCWWWCFSSGCTKT